VEGQAEVETLNKSTGRPLNGTLKYQLTDPRTASMFAPLWDETTKNWTVLSDVKVWFNEAGDQHGTGANDLSPAIRAIPAESNGAAYSILPAVTNIMPPVFRDTIAPSLQFPCAAHHTHAY